MRAAVEVDGVRRSPWLPRVVLGIVLLYVLIALPVGLRNTFLRLRAAVRTAGLSAGELRPRVFGPRYVAAIDQIRRTIPVDEPYLISEMEEPGAQLWVRFDLLPRRAILLRPAAGSPPPPTPDCWRQQVRFMVVAAGVGRPPLFYERSVTVPPGCPPAPPWIRSE
jgi:hypothetical protein